MLYLWIDLSRPLTGLRGLGSGYPALERSGGRAAWALGVPGYSQTRLTALGRSRP